MSLTANSDQLGQPAPNRDELERIPMRRTPTATDAPSKIEPALNQPPQADQVRDDILRHELEQRSALSAATRHRERLTATEAEEDDFIDNEDEAVNITDLRKQFGGEDDFDSQ